MRKSVFFCTLFIATLVSSTVYSQITITGIVLYEDDRSSLSGVIITEKGTENITITTMDGSYAITVKDTSSILTFAFVGLIERELAVGKQRVINTSLKPYVRSEAWDQKLRFFLNSGLLETPFRRTV